MVLRSFWSNVTSFPCDPCVRFLVKVEACVVERDMRKRRRVRLSSIFLVIDIVYTFLGGGGGDRVIT